MVMDFNQVPRFLEPDEPWQIEKTLSLFEDMNWNFNPFKINSII